eukprot:TRINITY_DN1723_c0_g1_i1.p1 TRINITY_DN1723_c0_g1~~TRINITY_DN1723_c0_g1_i1.p1  ORF type:complete len:482 (+),score=205.45 TRINITY_DN1723_c0_g1_i1:73-1446(+)
MDEFQRRGAFQAFDLEGTGEITQFDLRYAFQACESIATLVSEKDVVMAMRRCGVPQGSMVTFPQFSAMCDFVENFLRPKKRVRDFASNLPAVEAREDVEECQGSPRRTTRSMPLELWHDKDESYPLQALPQSPVSPRACLGELPGMDAIAHAFYAFDMDYSGAVSSIELPSMLRMVPKRTGGHLGPPPASAKPKQHQKYEDRIRRCMAVIGKQWADLLNLHDFQAIVDMLDPPPPPKQPDEEGYETTESERERRREEEERRRREEEARQEAEKINAATIVVQYDGGYLVLHFCEAGDSVASIMRKIIEKLPHLQPKQMRLIGRGFEMDPRTNLDRYGIKVGHPQTHGGDILQLIVRGDEAPKDDTVEIVSGMLNLRREDASMLQVYAEDDEPLEYLQQRIEEQEGTPVPWQRLVVHGREMNPKHTLKDYEVTLGPDGDVVDLLVRGVGAIPPRMQWR